VLVLVLVVVVVVLLLLLLLLVLLVLVLLLLLLLLVLTPSVQGEGGNVSVAGSWLRVFGRNLALPLADDSTAERRRSIAAENLAVQQI